MPLDINTATADDLDAIPSLTGHGPKSSASATNAAASPFCAIGTRCPTCRASGTTRRGSG